MMSFAGHGQQLGSASPPYAEHRPTGEAAAFREEVCDWLKRMEGSLERFRRIPRDSEAIRRELGSLQHLLYDAGLLRRGWPENAGGLGGSPLLRGILSEELAEAGYPPPFSFGVLEVLAAPLLDHADARLIAEALPPLLSGQETWCQGFSEPEAGSDLASLRTRAVLNGNHFIISGQKIWTSWAHHASRMLLLARTGTREDGHRGISAFLVDMDTQGIAVRPLVAMNGDEEFAEVFFDDVRVPEDRLIGAVGGGWALAMQVLACERGALAWQRQAWMRSRFRDLITAAPLSDGTSAERMGSVYEKLWCLRLRARQTFRRMAAGDTAGPDASVDKVLMASTEQDLFDAAVDLLQEEVLLGQGERAAEWRNDYAYSRAATIYGGSSEIQRNILAQRVLGLPRQS